MNMTDDFNTNQEDYSFLLENMDNEIEIVVEDFIELDLKELADLFIRGFRIRAHTISNSYREVDCRRRNKKSEKNRRTVNN